MSPPPGCAVTRNQGSGDPGDSSGWVAARLASSASIAVSWAWIGTQAGELGRARARLATNSRRARSSLAKVSAVTSCSRTGGYPGAVGLLGQHGVQLGAQRSLNRSAGEDPLDGALQQAAVVAQLVAS